MNSKLELVIDEFAISYQLVDIVRNSLASKYDVGEGSEYEDFRGLCDAASDKFVKLFNEHYGEGSRHPIGTAKIVHGELKHSPKCYSRYWCLQHTWVEISVIDGSTLYVDPTSGQFKYIFDDILDYSVSAYPLRWYLPDRKNIRFANKLMRYIDRHPKLQIIVNDPSYGSMNYGFIEYLQFIIWGKISDWIRRTCIER